MTRNKKLGAFRSKARSLTISALLVVYSLATPSMSGLILIAANTAAQAKAGSGGHGSSGHSSGSSSSHGGNAHRGGPSGTGAPGAVGNKGASLGGVSHSTTTPVEGSGHGGHAPCPSAECP